MLFAATVSPAGELEFAQKWFLCQNLQHGKWCHADGQVVPERYKQGERKREGRRDTNNTKNLLGLVRIHRDYAK